MTNLNSKIEWTDCTWSPTVGCTKVSPGCDNCYAETITERFHGKGSFAEVKLHHNRIDAPLHWRKPRRVFVNSMSDLFHDAVPSAFIAAVFDVMRQTPQHTYQILTKRHARMRSLMRSAVPGEGWPLPNVHLGVSVEDQKRADLRIPALLDTPAAVRFLSCEPLLGPVDLLPGDHTGHEREWYGSDYICNNCSTDDELVIFRRVSFPNIDWVIVGGESGHAARPCNMEWIRSLVKQCTSVGVPVFVKQLGSVWAHENGWPGKGGLPEQWPTDLHVREFPTAVTT